MVTNYYNIKLLMLTKSLYIINNNLTIIIKLYDHDLVNTTTTNNNKHILTLNRNLKSLWTQ